jgi:hypothetical protein
MSRSGDQNWDEAKRMLESSTNTASSSEQVMWAITRKGQDTVYVGKDPTVTCQDKWGDNVRT